MTYGIPGQALAVIFPATGTASAAWVCVNVTASDVEAPEEAAINRAGFFLDTSRCPPYTYILLAGADSIPGTKERMR